MQSTLAKWGITGQSRPNIVTSEKQAKDRMSWFIIIIIIIFFNLLIFVNFDMLTVQIVRNFDENWKWNIFLRKLFETGSYFESQTFLFFLFNLFLIIYFSDIYINVKYTSPYLLIWMTKWHEIINGIGNQISKGFMHAKKLCLTYAQSRLVFPGLLI